MRPFLIGSLLVVLSCPMGCDPASQAAQVAAIPLVEKVLKSVVRVEHRLGDEHQYICTGFVVSPIAVLTVQHCIGPEMFIDGKPSRLLKTNDTLALLSMPAFYKPALEIRKAMLLVGEKVRTIGFGYGTLLVFSRTIAAKKDGDIALDGAVVPGMSGGPIVDEDGVVVGINQSLINDKIGVGCGQDEIMVFLK